MTDAQKEPPRELTDDRARQMGRWARDTQWKFADAVLEHGTLWFCWWNKNRHHPEEGRPDDLWVSGLIVGMEILDWLRRHDDWWVIGKWNDARYAAPVSLTDAGRAALADRERYDMEPVYGGLVEPGFVVVPAERAPE